MGLGYEPSTGLYGFPMPPPANNLYPTRGKFRVKSQEYRRFEDLAWIWAARNPEAITRAKELKPYLAPSHIRFICIDHSFWFPKEALISKKHTLKKNDTTNRFKALHDVLAKLLEVDDSWFWTGTYEKHINQHRPDKPKGWVDLKLTLVERTL